MGLGAVALGCSVAPVDYGSDANTGTTHALITVERSDSPSTADAPRATAFAGFVRTPPEVDAHAVLQLAGFGLDLPAIGQCSGSAHQRDNSVPLSPLGRVEFLDAGDVVVHTDSTTATLAPRAFPSVTELIAGVVYTTRDRDAQPLPAGANYTLSTSGGVLSPMSVITNAPASLVGVTVDSTTFAELHTVSQHSSINLSWEPGQPSDLVYVELTSRNGSATTRCTFRDDTGSGIVPAGAFTGVGAGDLSLHRVRSQPFASGGVDAGEVRFDFEQTASVVFSD